MFDVDQFLGAFVARSNERAAQARLRQIHALWPPPETCQQTPGRDALDALLERISGSNERSVVEGGYRFDARSDAERMGSVLKFNWQMTDHAGNVAALALKSPNSTTRSGSKPNISLSSRTWPPESIT
jgi:hypothetical protein